ncbi:MAG TPA: acyl-CoA reductase, partial [Longimicrobiales bacterium]|nr:acyl-CoA reductase [Longimicrobiales bacterium]
AVAFFDQRGCVSPQVVYVEEGGLVTPRDFARELAHAMGVLEDHLPGGTLDPDEASARHQLVGTAELLAASGSGVELHRGGDAGWAVIFDPASAFAPSCVGRVVRVKPVADVLHTPTLVAPFARHLQSVGVAGCGDRLPRLAEELARAGVSRITGFDAMPFPSPAWHHDGQGPLRALVGWVDLEL